MKVSLLISVYNRADFLEKILSSLVHQSRLPDELIICEDGRNPSIKECVDRWSGQYSYPVFHITQIDNGNRKTLCMNKGFAQATGEYIPTIDGDCVLHKHYIRAHCELADEKCFLTGRRVELSEKASEFLTAEKIKEGYLNAIPYALVWDALKGNTHHAGRLFQTPRILCELLNQNEILDIRGCNFSVHRKHLVSVNGYNNNFSGAYGEDTDLEIRLKTLGLRMKSVKGRAIQYHLWHKSQTHDLNNQTLLEQLRAQPNAKAVSGLREASEIE